MESVREALLNMIDGPEPFNQPRAEIEAMQLEAARELFAERRTQIAVLRRRAADTGINEIRSRADLVPLLFAHTTYKSYPETFIERGRWDHMLTWLQTLSVRNVTDTDVSGVTNADEWIERLEAAGHHILATSGTSGKCSFLNQAPIDLERKRRHWRVAIGWPQLTPNRDRPFFSFIPHRGPNSAVEAANLGAELWAPPDKRFFLEGDPLRITDVAAAAALRNRIANSTATPAEIEAFELKARQKTEQAKAAVLAMADRILEHRHEPIVLQSLWAQHMMIIDRARELGVPDGDFHPDSLISAGGGIKGISLPPDYKERVTKFYGNVKRGGSYGMTELYQSLAKCEANHYHPAPGLILMVLDPPGERLLGPEDAVDGIVEGRAAFLDLLFEGRWGGLISGDKIQVRYGTCPCGRNGPTVLDTIVRYAQTGDDHIGCAGTIESYIRSSVAAA